MSNIIIPFRGNMGVQTTPPYSNTKSLLFDGIDDYIDLGSSTDLGFSSDFTLSAWVKTSAIGANQFIIDNSNNASNGSGYSLRLLTTGQVRFWSYLSTSSIDSTTTLMPNTWYHIATTTNATTFIHNIYINGVLDVSGPSGTLNIVPTTNLRIGTAALFGFPFNGNIDEPCFFNRELIQAEITTLSTAPTVDLTSLSPIAWYRNGDNGSYKSPQWLLPSNENKDKISNYSYEFQGINSRQIDVGTVNVGTTNTTSMWLKRNVVSTQQTLLGGSSLTFPDYHMLLFTGNDFYIRYSNTVYVGWSLTNVTNVFNDTTNWINIVVVRSGNTVNLHLNGGAAIAPNLSAGGAIGALDTKFTDIGADSNGTNPTNGTVNNVATWNVDSVLPSEIYNGGVPNDLTTLSTAPVNWWKMGEDATLVYGLNPIGAWTIPDQVGTNDGTNTATIFNRVGFAPSSENNAVSINMDFVDVVADTP